MAEPAMEGSFVWTFNLGMENYMALYSYILLVPQTEDFCFHQQITQQKWLRPNRSCWLNKILSLQSSCHIWLQVTLSGCYFVGTLDQGILPM